MHKFGTRSGRAPIANLPNSAQLEGTSTIPSSYTRVRAVVWECGDGQTDTQTAMTYMHFASSVPHAKCKSYDNFVSYPPCSHNCSDDDDVYWTGSTNSLGKWPLNWCVCVHILGTWYGDGAGNTVEENSSIFSLI